MSRGAFRNKVGSRLVTALFCFVLALASVAGAGSSAHARSDGRVTGQYYVSVFEQTQLPDSLDQISTDTSLYSEAIVVPRAIDTSAIPAGGLPLFDPSGVDQKVLVVQPSLERISSACVRSGIAFDPQRDKVVWYVVKPQLDGWHVDGAILRGQLEPQVPAEPAEPQEPEGPVEPVEPVEPAEPQEPQETPDPEEPSEPLVPDQPEAPSSDRPLAPEEPKEPEGPDGGQEPYDEAPAASKTTASSGEQEASDDAELPETGDEPFDDQDFPTPVTRSVPQDAPGSTEPQPQEGKEDDASLASRLSVAGEMGAGALSFALAGLLVISVGRTLSLSRFFGKIGGGKR